MRIRFNNDYICPIKGHEDYCITRKGEIYSRKKGFLARIKPWLDSQGRYYLIRLDGKSCLIHRLVAQAFVPNPYDYPVVDHCDNDTKNNDADNLQWCTVKYNVSKTYLKVPPARNYVDCELFKGTDKIGTFKGIKKAARFASKKYGASYSSLERHRRWKDMRILSGKGNIPQQAACSKVQNRNPISVYNKHGYRIGVFKTGAEVSDYFTNELHIPITASMVAWYYTKRRTFKGYTITREQRKV